MLSDRTSRRPGETAAATGPSPSDEAKPGPLGAPAPVAVESPAHRFTMLQPSTTEPVAYDPCRPIHAVVNGRAAPPGGDEIPAAALAERGHTCRLLGARVPGQALMDAVRRVGPVGVVLWSHTETTAARANLEARGFVVDEVASSDPAESPDDVGRVASQNPAPGEEHERGRPHAGKALSDDERDRLRAVGVGLDRCGDLLGQRGARRSAGQDPDEATVRPEEVVERYQQ